MIKPENVLTGDPHVRRRRARTPTKCLYFRILNTFFGGIRGGSNYLGTFFGVCADVNWLQLIYCGSKNVSLGSTILGSCSV